jgi:nucleoside-diphosphate-sugar epimerase
MNHLLCLGFGYTAATLARSLDKMDWRISGTSRSAQGAAAITAQGYEGSVFDQLKTIPANVTHILSSVAPDEMGDAVLRNFADQLKTPNRWLGYLSTTGVYGDRAGGWVDEESTLAPVSARAERRVEAEKHWQPLGAHIFRLPGIYGPTRNALEFLREGKAKRVIKPGQIFSRIHVEDIVGALRVSIAKPNPGRIYNVADDEPCPPQDVITYAAKLLGLSPPPEVPIDKANLSPMALSFYDESKRVSNARMKAELGYQLLYPNYRDGLTAIFRNSPHLHAPPD